MTGDVPTIDQALTSFLAEKQAAIKPSAFRNYADIIDLLKGSLNGYAYESLDRFERRRWEKAFEDGDEEAFTKLFGPDKIPGHLGEFLGYFMIRKVIAPAELIAAAGRVTKELAEWLGERGWIGSESIADAVERSDDAARDLPRAERLGRLLYEQAQRTRIDQSALADDDYVEDYLAIERVEPTALWFEGEIGPVPISAAAAKLAQPGWSINVVLGRKGGKWRFLEVGNVYP
ncbi:MAG: hypothetical protein H0V74_02355 [Chloroflexi bacterium]|nr:hypothetical protein [Chloroflexota bacterium]